jgi:hypothetical protein
VGDFFYLWTKKRDTLKCPITKVEIMKKVKDKKGDFVRF